jgi:uncharacterized protein YndB with AHSA1/START domain
MSEKEPLSVTAAGDREIVMTRTFDAPRTLVFDAFTKPELVKQWLLGPPGHTMPVCEIDLRAGGKIRYVWRLRNGSDMGMSGAFREVVAPERTVHTESFDEDWTGGEAVVTTRFDERDGKTTVTTTVLYSSRDARDGAMKSGMESGVAISYDRLDDIFASAMRS